MICGGQGVIHLCLTPIMLGEVIGPPQTSDNELHKTRINSLFLFYLPSQAADHLHFKTGIYSKYSDKLENTCLFSLCK